jgi:hypothetical protein
LKRWFASGSSGFLSGWCFCAIFRNAALISSWVADRSTPSTSYGSFIIAREQ